MIIFQSLKFYFRAPNGSNISTGTFGIVKLEPPLFRKNSVADLHSLKVLNILSKVQYAVIAQLHVEWTP